MCVKHGMTVVVALCLGIALESVCMAGFVGVGDGNAVTATAGSFVDDGSSRPVNMTWGTSMTPNDPVTMASTMANNCYNEDMWVSLDNPADTDKWVSFTFADNISLAGMTIWNFNQSCEDIGYPGSKLWHRGLKDVTITYSTGDDASGSGNPLFSGQLNCATGSPVQSYTDDLSFSGAADVKAVRIAYTSNWADAGDVGGYNVGKYGLSKVFFTAVPEPSGAVLLITAIFGLLGFAWHRHK